MPGYRYRITVEPLTDKRGEPLEAETLVFEAENHDEILGIAASGCVERVSRHGKREKADETFVASLWGVACTREDLRVTYE